MPLIIIILLTVKLSAAADQPASRYAIKYDTRAVIKAY